MFGSGKTKNEDYSKVAQALAMQSAEQWEQQPRAIGLAQDNIGMIREFSKDSSIPFEIREVFWGFVAPEVIWANFNQDDEMQWDNLVHLGIEKIKAAVPYFEHTPEMDVQFTNLVAAVRRKIMRARGTDRERVLLATSIQERRYSQTGQSQQKSGVRGFLGRLLGG